MYDQANRESAHLTYSPPCCRIPCNPPSIHLCATFYNTFFSLFFFFWPLLVFFCMKNKRQTSPTLEEILPLNWLHSTGMFLCFRSCFRITTPLRTGEAPLISRATMELLRCMPPAASLLLAACWCVLGMLRLLFFLLLLLSVYAFNSPIPVFRSSLHIYCRSFWPAKQPMSTPQIHRGILLCTGQRLWV